MNYSHIARYQLPLLLWLVIIFFLSAIPNVPTFKFIIGPDKLAHAGIYFVLCMLSMRALYYQDVWTWGRDHALLMALLFTFLYGILDEVHQIFVPGRWADVYDVCADAFGGLLFAAYLKGRDRWRKRDQGAAV